MFGEEGPTLSATTHTTKLPDYSKSPRYIGLYARSAVGARAWQSRRTPIKASTCFGGPEQVKPLFHFSERFAIAQIIPKN